MSPQQPLSRRRFIVMSAGAASVPVLGMERAFASHGGAHIDNVIVVPYWVAPRRLDLRIEYSLDTAQPGASFEVQIAERDGTTTGLPGGSFPLSQTGMGSGLRQTVSLPWENPSPWDVGAPHLYHANVEIKASGGGTLATYATERTGTDQGKLIFGFRQVYRNPLNRRELMINDHPLKLHQAPFMGTVAHMFFYSGMGMNAVEFQPNSGTWASYPPVDFPAPADYPDLYNAADENGWIIFMPTVSVGATKNQLNDCNTNNDGTWLSQVRMANKDFDKQNRPSIVAWVPGMNEIGNGQNARYSIDPVAIGRELDTALVPKWVERADELLKSEYPSQLFVIHEGGPVSDVHFGNVYLGMLPLQERLDFLSKWAADGDIPYGSAEFGPPTTAPFFKYRLKRNATSDGIPYFTEYFAEYLGDHAYAVETDTFVNDVAAAAAHVGAANKAWGESFQAIQGFWRLASYYDPTAGQVKDGSTAYDDYMDLFIRNTNKTWRAWGLNAGCHPWVQDVGFGHYPPDGQGMYGEKHNANRWIDFSYVNLQNDPRYQDANGKPDPVKLRERPEWANRLYDAYRATLQPLLLFLGGPEASFTAKDHTYRSGEVADRTIVAVWDGPGSTQVSTTWELRRADNNSLVSNGAEAFTLTAGAVERRGLSIPLPTVTQRTDYTLILKDATTTLDETGLSVFPAPQTPTLTRNWAIHDPTGKTNAELERLGFNLTMVQPGDDLSSYGCLVIGRGALSETSKLLVTPEQISQGFRVVVFEQSADALEAMGFRTEDRVPRYVFRRTTDHPVLAVGTEREVAASDLVDWRGSADLVPATKDNKHPYRDTRMHWGNNGSVASVVVETPHQGSFTPILESCFDLAYSPLLEWRHGAGSVVFCQLDVSGRKAARLQPAGTEEPQGIVEPAADLLMSNIIRYADGATLSGSPATRGVAFVGSDAADKALMDAVGFTYRTASALNLALQPGELVVIGRNATTTLPVTSRQQLSNHVQNGGSVVFLPRTATELNTSTWPWSVTTTPQSLARVLPPATATALTRGIGPQLTHWRTKLALNVIATSGLPAGSERLLDGLVGRVPDGSGQWVVSQFDWRALDSGGNNTRRPKWNARKFYRQIFTNLGATSTDSVVSGLSPSKDRAPMVTLGPWLAGPGSALGSGTVAAQGGYHFNVPPGLDAAFAANVSGTTVVQPDAKGYIDLATVVPNGTSSGGPVAGQVAYAHTFVYSTVARTATFVIQPRYWMVFRVNGKVLVNDSVDGNAFPTDGIDTTYPAIGVALRAGWNRLEVGVCCTYRTPHYETSDKCDPTKQTGKQPQELGFSMTTEDPGDLVVSASAAQPPAPTTNTPQFGTRPIDWYVERPPRPEDPYRYQTY